MPNLETKYLQSTSSRVTSQQLKQSGFQHGSTGKVKRRKLSKRTRNAPCRQRCDVPSIKRPTGTSIGTQATPRLLGREEKLHKPLPRLSNVLLSQGSLQCTAATPIILSTWSSISASKWNIISGHNNVRCKCFLTDWPRAALRNR